MAAALDIREAKRELHDLRVEEWSDLGLAAVAIVVSLVATEFAQTLTLPFFVGGLVVAIAGGRAFFRRWDLCQQLLLDPSAYEISEIHDQAEHLATVEERRRMARSIRSILADPGIYRASRVELVAQELTELADELEDELLVLEPICAVRCRRLLSAGVESPLLDPAVPADGLRIAIVQIRAGFEGTL
jgi:hypothetical protein